MCVVLHYLAVTQPCGRVAVRVQPPGGRAVAGPARAARRAPPAARTRLARGRGAAIRYEEM